MKARRLGTHEPVRKDAISLLRRQIRAGTLKTKKQAEGWLKELGPEIVGRVIEEVGGKAADKVAELFAPPKKDEKTTGSK